ncbi:MAG: YcxB family protein [Candidatus Faecivicinus sp.]
MEAKFEVHFSVTKEACRALNEAQLSGKGFKYVVPACGVLILLGSAVLWYAQREDAWLFTVLGLFFLLIGLFWGRFCGWMTWRRMNRAVGETVCVFGDETFAIRNRLESGESKYPVLIKLVETDGYFLLYVQKGVAYIVPKNAFTVGDPAQFAAFIEEKTGLKFRRVRSR